MSTSQTTRVTLVLPTETYEQIELARDREEIPSVAGFIRQAVEEKLARLRWQRDLADLRQDIEAAGGLGGQGSKEQVIERLRASRCQIFEAEYAHLYR